jgi:hypothetical protein
LKGGGKGEGYVSHGYVSLIMVAIRNIPAISILLFSLDSDTSFIIVDLITFTVA